MRPRSLRVWQTRLLFAALALVCRPAWCWQPPEGPDGTTADPARPGTHGIILLRAIDVLRADGLGQMADIYGQLKQELLDGERAADYGNGTFDAVTERWLRSAEKAVFRDVPTDDLSRNSFTHFYNPATGRGLFLGKAARTLIDASRTWRYSTLVGPEPAATDMADWWYANAVKQMRADNRQQAARMLGYALHLVQDCCVPQHASDEVLSNHAAFEVWTNSNLDSLPHATSGGVYHDDWRPSQFVEEAAKQSRAWGRLASHPDTFQRAASLGVPFAERLTAGLMARFLRRWSDEDFAVVLLTIDRVDAVHNPDNWLAGEADYYPRVTMGDRQYVAGYIQDCNHPSPQLLITHCWVFPRWIAPASASPPLPIRIGLWDSDMPLEWPSRRDDHCDVSPLPNKMDLEMTFDLATGAVEGEASARRLELTGQTQVTASGDGKNRDRYPATITLSIECAPGPMTDGRQGPHEGTIACGE